MDNILEETSNEKEKENISSIPIHASVIKLENKNKDEENNINFKSLKVNNPGNQILNNNYITNNYYLTNNYYTINYNKNYNNYYTQFSNTLVNKGNNNRTIPYPSYNQYFTTFPGNEYH